MTTLDDDNMKKIKFFIENCVTNNEKDFIFRAQGVNENAKQQNENNRIHFELSKTNKIEFVEVEFLSYRHAVICEVITKQINHSYVIVGCVAAVVFLALLVFILFKKKVSSTSFKLLKIICLYWFYF